MTANKRAAKKDVKKQPSLGAGGSNSDAAAAVLAWRKMLLIRECEEQLNTAFSKNLFPGYIHSYQGQEACAVGVCANLRDDDNIVSTHRGRGHYLAKGMALEPMIGEMFGKANGICGGRGGEMHAADPELGILGGNGIVGGGLPYATGAAYSAVLEGSDRVCAVFFGDGATNQGSFHEALNISAAWTLPIIFVCENNLYAEMTPFEKTVGMSEIARRADAYGISGEAVDGNDVMAVISASKNAVNRARNGEGPTLLELRTYRHGGHFQGDPCNYRTREEEVEWHARDPLPLHRKFLLQESLVTVAQLDEWAKDARGQVSAAIELALSSPDPDPEDALLHVYAE